MRFILLFLALTGFHFSLSAQEIVLPIGKHNTLKELHLAVYDDSVRAFVLEGPETLEFWAEDHGSFVSLGDQKYPISKYIGSTCTSDNTSFFFETVIDKKIVRYDIGMTQHKRGVSISTPDAPKGKPLHNFVHDDTLYYLTFIKSSNSLLLHRYGPGSKPTVLSYTLPKTKAVSYANTSYNDINNLSYRSIHLDDPSILYNKQHIFMANDAMYLVYPKYSGKSDVFIIIKMGLKDGSLNKNIIQHTNALDSRNASLYLSDNTFILYTSSENQITLTAIDAATWIKQDFYILSKDEEKLNNIPIRQEDSKMWWNLMGDEDREVDQKKLLRKLFVGGEAYVYVNPVKDSTDMQEIVIGRYGEHYKLKNTAPIPGTTGTPGIGGPPTDYAVGGETYTSHRYMMLQYDKKAGTIQPTRAITKTPTSVWEEIVEEEFASELTVLGLASTPKVVKHHLGDRALFAYIDKKRDAVIARYEPLK